MSNETMPEKIYENFVDGEGMTVRQIADAFPNIAIGELARDITDLRRQNAALKAFAKATWDVLDEQAFEAGASLGVFDTDQYGGYAFAYWMLTDTAALPAPSKAEVAREFWDELYNKTWHKDGHLKNGIAVGERILRQWEANEVNDA